MWTQRVTERHHNTARCRHPRTKSAPTATGCGRHKHSIAAEQKCSRANTTVKLSGFIMPLDPDIEQRHFLLTSNPPSCFFHIPGGPAGAVEVFASEGIEATWNPVVIEGRLETLDTGEYGVIYRLQDARAVEP